ncbi:MAG: GHMP kinase [Spartobacteria bacterium]|nr:GHMP kinase [Spartobacteria bacterium]
MLITQTPLRISLAGGGTDMSAYFTHVDGAVVSSAIDKYIYVILNQRFDDKIYISYSKKEIVDTVDEIQHELVREAMRIAGVQKGVEIAIMADIPSEGSGLGSSSSLTVGLLNAFYTYRNVQVTAEQLAREACSIEIDICKKPIGKQDQYIAAYGGLRYFQFLRDGSVRVEELPIGKARTELGAHLMLFYTNITRSANSILKEQTERTVQNMEFLHGIRALADEAKDAILIAKYEQIGRILRKNWELKKQLANGIARPEIEQMVERAMQGGADGCKLSGAGGGGFLLTYCTRSHKSELRQALFNYREMPFFLEKSGSKVIFNVDSYDWK